MRSLRKNPRRHCKAHSFHVTTLMIKDMKLRQSVVAERRDMLEILFYRHKLNEIQPSREIKKAIHLQKTQGRQTGWEKRRDLNTRSSEDANSGTGPGDVIV